MKLPKLLALLLALIFAVALVTGCNGTSANLPAGLPLYTKDATQPTGTLTQEDIDQGKVSMVDSDWLNHGKVLIFDATGNGKEWYYKIEDLPKSTATPGPQGTQTAGGTGGQPAQPAQTPEVLVWLDKYVIGLWQLWVGIILDALFSFVFVYNWVTSTKTPKPLNWLLDKIATKISVYTFDLQLMGSYIKSAEPDRANSFNDLEGRTEAEKLNSAKELIKNFLEGEINTLAAMQIPENVNDAIARWLRALNKELENADWGNPSGMLVNFPVTGLEVRNIKLTGFIPGTEMAQYLATPNEASRHAIAMKKLQDEFGLTKRETVELYKTLNAADAERDKAKAISSAIENGIKAFAAAKGEA